jgi:hypothetical protein
LCRCECQIDHRRLLWFNLPNVRFQFELLDQSRVITRHPQLEHEGDAGDVLDLDQLLVVEVEGDLAEVDAVHVELEGGRDHVALEVERDLLVGVFQDPFEDFIELAQAVADEGHVDFVFFFDSEHSVGLRKLET